MLNLLNWVNVIFSKKNLDTGLLPLRALPTGGVLKLDCELGDFLPDVIDFLSKSPSLSNDTVVFDDDGILGRIMEMSCSHRLSFQSGQIESLCSEWLNSIITKGFDERLPLNPLIGGGVVVIDTGSVFNKLINKKIVIEKVINGNTEVIAQCLVGDYLKSFSRVSILSFDSSFGVEDFARSLQMRIRFNGNNKANLLNPITPFSGGVTDWLWRGNFEILKFTSSKILNLSTSTNTISALKDLGVCGYELDLITKINKMVGGDDVSLKGVAITAIQSVISEYYKGHDDLRIVASLGCKNNVMDYDLKINQLSSDYKKKFINQLTKSIKLELMNKD